MDIALQAVYTGTDKGNWSVGKVPSWNTHKYADGKAGKGANRGGKSMAEGQWQDRRQRTKGKVARATAAHAGLVATQDTLQLRVQQEATHTHLYAIGGEESGVNEEAFDNEEELQAWCVVEESEHEQWQEVISSRDKPKTVANRACLTAECGTQSKFESQEIN